MAQQPLDLGGGEIRVKDETGFFPDGWLLALQFLAERCRSPVLPDDRGTQRFSGGTIPKHGRFPLVRDPYPRDPVGVDVTRAERLFNRLDGGGPYLLRLVFDPSRFRIVLRKFVVFFREQVEGPVQDDNGGPGCPLIDGEDQIFHVPAWVACEIAFDNTGELD